MFKDLSELKEFVLWCKVQKIKSFRLGDTEIELSELALVESLQDLSTPEATAPKDLSAPPSSPRIPNGNAQANEEEELLFWSARNS